MTETRVMRWPEVHEKVGLARNTVWVMEKAGRFPHRIKISTNAMGWRSDEISQWLDDRERGGGYRPASRRAPAA
jgi:prophage regulatory protein